jgi:hypothetical protein
VDVARTTVALAVACVAAGALVFAGGRVMSSPSSPRRSPSPSTVVVPENGSGTFTRAGGTSRKVGTGKALRYRVEVEKGTGQDPTEFARWVDRILADPRGWTAGGEWAFVRVREEPVDFVVRLATPDTVDEVCARYGLRTDGEASCRGQENVMVNLRRWLLAIPAYRADVESYRHLVINHEVGHFLGHSHVTCPGQGKPAPVMQTQMYGLHGCRPNAWPYVDGHYVD